MINWPPWFEVYFQTFWIFWMCITLSVMMVLVLIELKKIYQILRFLAGVQKAVDPKVSHKKKRKKSGTTWFQRAREWIGEHTGSEYE